MKFKVTFKKGLEVVAEVKGFRELQREDLHQEEIAMELLESEQLLETLTGYRVHIEQVQ